MADAAIRGPLWGSGGSSVPLTAGLSGGQRAQNVHGEQMDALMSGRLITGGMPATTIANATFTTATLGATATPIVGIWNPGTNDKNLLVLRVYLQVYITALQNTGPGAFMWCTSTGNNAISTGNQPFNPKTWLATGSNVKDMSGLALTGLTNNLVVRRAAAVAGGSAWGLATLATAASFNSLLAPSVEFFDGGLLVPPGGVLALLCTVTPVAQSAACGWVGEEIPTTYGQN